MIITYIAWAVFIYGTYHLYSNFKSLPDEIALQYGLDGEVTNRGPKSTMWIMVGIGFMMACLFSYIGTMELAALGLIMEATHLSTQLLFTYLIVRTVTVSTTDESGLGQWFWLFLGFATLCPLSTVFFT